MKPVRIVQDIVHAKSRAGSKGGKVKFGYITAAARAARTVLGFRIPFYIWFVVVLAAAVGVVKLAPTALSYPWISQLFTALTNPAPATNVQQQEAALVRNIIPSLPTSTINGTSSNILPPIKPGLLPMGQFFPFKPTGAATSTSSKESVPQTGRSKSPATPTVVTAKSLLDATTLSASERYDGYYGITLTTDAGTYGRIRWGLDGAPLAVGGSVPAFSVSYSCDPAPNMAAANALDQNPTFDVKTSYVCTIGLTPTSGSDRSTRSKQFSFTTGTGQLVVTPPSAMDTLLHDGKDFGGFIFNNENSEPITITGLDLDMSYVALDTANNPLVVQFLDPVTNVPLSNYHLETLAADPSSPYVHAGTVNLPLSFTVGTGTQKMLPIDVVGVQRLQIDGVDPTVTLTVRGVASNQNMNKTVLNSATISWSCVNAPVGGYDPNATSGPYATGRVCR
jgi:hypothetical protein